jgi:hypothetical protein
METFIKKGEYKRLYNNTYLMVDVMDYRGCVIAKFYDTELADEYIAFKMGKNKPVEIPEITDEGNLLFNEMGEFSVKTFTGATAKGHLRKLKEEADEAIEDPTDIKEYADCLMALFGAAYKAGFTYDALIQAGKEKLEINKSRKWVKLENEIYQHIKE